jgi:hypothetical protein
MDFDAWRSLSPAQATHVATKKPVETVARHRIATRDRSTLA